MQEQDKFPNAKDTEQDTQGDSLSSHEDHINGWGFLQWLIMAIGYGLEEAWEEHPMLCVILVVLLLGLILVLTGHLDGMLFWMWLFG